MAKTALERKHESLARKREAEERAPDPIDKIAYRKFSEFFAVERERLVFDQLLEEVGIEPPEFDHDEDAQWQEDWGIGPNRRSIGRAERMVGALLDAAGELAGAINKYKLELLDGAVATLQAADFTTPEAKARAFDEMVRLAKIRDHLTKQVRWSLPQWKTKGV